MTMWMQCPSVCERAKANHGTIQLEGPKLMTVNNTPRRLVTKVVEAPNTSPTS